MRKRRYRRCLGACLLLFCTMVSLWNCGKKTPSDASNGALSYEGIVIEEYLSLGVYTDLEILLTSENDSRGEAVWNAVLANSVLHAYPEEQVNYYVSQEKARCRYYAEQKQISFEEAMSVLETNEEKMLSDAKDMVAKDLCYRAVVKAANIVVTEEEKARLFNKYVAKYVSDWGYDAEYVKKNLLELVYDSMLYDKTTEFLIKENTFRS